MTLLANMQRRTRLIATTALSTALVGSLAMICAPAARAQDTGDPCVMIGSACVITSAPPKAPDGSTDGQPGSPGASSANLAHNFTDANFYQSAPLIYSPINVTSVGGEGGQGRDATRYEFGHNGGAGGPGGDAGALTIQTGPQVEGLSTTIASGITIISEGGAGGAAGAGDNNGSPGQPLGVGGAAGAIYATNLAGNWSSNAGAGAFIQSLGGAGGFGQDSSEIGFSTIAPDGANGGNGADVTATLLGHFQGQGTDTEARFQLGGTYVGSAGGAGGAGGPNAGTVGNNGGAGGNGGAAGDVTATLASGASAANSGDLSAGLWVQSIGGAGGVGGSADAAGAAGQGGAAGSATAIIDGTVSSDGYLAPGVLVQSIGGKGSDGGNGAGWFNPQGGPGAAGGPAGVVNVSGSGAVITTGAAVDPTTGSPGILAQSVGGGGGTGGHSNGWFAVGGDGANAVAGQAVTVSLSSSSITTWGLSSDGVAAQSIGGGGGKGGDATGSGVGLNLTIGGLGGGGGDGGTVLVSSGAGDVITTNGDHAAGLLIQSVGGGGGDGGAAYGRDTSGAFGAQLSVGGSGGAGGAGGAVDMISAGGTTLPTNAGQIITAGADSYGIMAQSVGGGGGQGGASTAQTIVYSASDYPSLALAVAIGGSGGLGGAGGGVYTANTGLITTAGAGSVGILAQSVGGGGGAGGDASATSTASGGSYNISASMALGGSGGSGGNGASAQVANSGLILTTGEAGDGVLVQSIGGGGGAGGAGDAKATAKDDDNIALTLGVGGHGGGGGAGGNATAINTGAIITLGDGAIGIDAQSIGGGGGRAGGAAASTSGTYSVKTAIGGDGGAGGSTFFTGVVTVANKGTIVTFGADATGIFAQSIGGGGGIAGEAGTSLGSGKSTGDGGNGGNVNATIGQISQDFSINPNAINDYNSLNAAITTVNALLGNSAPKTAVGADDPVDELDATSGSSGETNDGNQAKSINLSLSIGGAGGVAGAAGAINVTNSGDIGTTGKMSDGIIAQAVGGGGGAGGAASTASTDDASGQLSVGGSGGAGGNGGQPTVVNSGGIITIGALSNGIVAQSIAGGGGIGGVSASSVSSSGATTGASGGNSSNEGQFSGMQLSIGGNGGANGESGQAVVADSGAIVTRGHDSIGILAQSIAGGGGIVKTLATNLDNAGGSATSQSSKTYDINLEFGGSHGSTGASGLVRVTTTKGGSITTSGDDSYGILAQSISGGGGLVQGGMPAGTSGSAFFGTGAMSGSVINDGGDNSGVFVEAGDNITTTGKGAIGILAQSIGGGGGLAGDTGWTEQFRGFGSGSNHSGSGGTIDVAVDAGSTISTSGDNAPAMFVQSVGGGGGRITNQTGAYVGTAGGTGTGGTIDITVNGTVEASGEASLGIFAQSVGDKTSDSPITIAIGQGGLVSGGPLFNGNGDITPAIYLDHGGMSASTPNVISNSGELTSIGGTLGTAVYGDYGYTRIINYPGGVMVGSVNLANNGGSGEICNGGTGACQPVSASAAPAAAQSSTPSQALFEAGPQVLLGGGTLYNAGVVSIGRSGSIATTTLSGNFVQGAGGQLLVDADLAAGKSDLLVVQGSAEVGGTVTLQASSVSNRPVTVLTATGGVTLEPSLQAAPRVGLYSFPVAVVDDILQIQPKAYFTATAAGLGSNQRAVAGNLQALFDRGSNFDTGFSALAGVKDAQSFATTLNSISGETLGAIAAFRFQTSRSFIANMYSGCAGFDQAAATPNQSNCVWSRVVGSDTTQDATGRGLGYNAQAVALQTGFQRQVAPNWFVSASVAYQTSQFTGDDASSQISGTCALVGAYLRYHKGPWTVSGALDTGYGWYDSTRVIQVAGQSAVATANPAAWHFGVHSQVSYEQPIGPAYVKPFADVHLAYIHSGGFTEQGSSPFDLAVEGQGNLAASGALGVEFGGDLKLAKAAILRPFASVAIETLNGNEWSSEARFANVSGGPTFRADTPAPTALGEFSVGAEVFSSAHVDLRVQYTPEVGDHYVTQAGVAKLAIRF